MEQVAAARRPAAATSSQRQEPASLNETRPTSLSFLKTEIVAAVSSLLVFWLAGRGHQANTGKRASPRWLWQLSRALRALLVYEGVRVGLGQGQSLCQWLRVQHQRAQRLADAVSDLGEVTAEAARDLRSAFAPDTADAAATERLERLLSLLCREPVRSLLADLVSAAVRAAREHDTAPQRSLSRPAAAASPLGLRPSLVAVFRELHSKNTPQEGATAKLEGQKRRNGPWGSSGLRFTQTIVCAAVSEAVRAHLAADQEERSQRRAASGVADAARFRFLSVLLNFASTEAGRRLVSESVAAAVAAAMPILLEDGGQERHPDHGRSMGVASSPSPRLARPADAARALAVTFASECLPSEATPVRALHASRDRAPLRDIASSASDLDRTQTMVESSPVAVSTTAASAPTSPFLERITRVALQEKEVLKEVASAAVSEAVRSYLLTMNEMHFRQQQQQQQQQQQRLVRRQEYSPSPDKCHTTPDSGAMNRADGAPVQTAAKMNDMLSRRDRLDQASTIAYHPALQGSLSSALSMVPLHALEKLISSALKRLLIGGWTTLQHSTAVLQPPLDAPRWLFW
jgi:hypothetical protein